LTQLSIKPSFYEGIDLLRAAAVFLVLWSHGGHLVPLPWRPWLFPTALRPGFWGVTLFFSISGFLIIGQLLDMGTGRRKESVSIFVLRRWLRTVPTYWLVLVLFLFLGAYPWPGWRLWFANSLFLQEWLIPGPALLPVSWTLVIEEFSYLAFAALFALLMWLARWRSSDGQRDGWVNASFFGVLLLLLPVGGWIRWHLAGLGWSVQDLKQGLLPRVDALAYGGLLAVFYRQCPEWFHVLAAQRFKLVVPVLVLMTLLGTTAPALFQQVANPLKAQDALWIGFGFYPLAGILASCLLLSLWRFRYALLPAAIRLGCRRLSRVSYSVYLIHLPIAALCELLPSTLAFPAYLLSSIILGALCWRILEQPFIRLRHAL
jgi:peptidoglycan/LPS O-acetylase OafA/YrhL